MNNGAIKYLLLEDEYYTALSIKMMIAKARPHYVLVGECESAKDAVSLIASTHPDLIISSVILCDGISLNTLRSCHIPVIIFTGFPNFRELYQLPNLVDYVLKPISEHDVATSLSKFEKSLLTT